MQKCSTIILIHSKPKYLITFKLHIGHITFKLHLKYIYYIYPLYNFLRKF